jgi:hypothetical protein
MGRNIYFQCVWQWDWNDFVASFQFDFATFKSQISCLGELSVRVCSSVRRRNASCLLQLGNQSRSPQRAAEGTVQLDVPMHPAPVAREAHQQVSNDLFVEPGARSTPPASPLSAAPCAFSNRSCSMLAEASVQCALPPGRGARCEMAGDSMKCSSEDLR